MYRKFGGKGFYWELIVKFAGYSLKLEPSSRPAKRSLQCHKFPLLRGLILFVRGKKETGA